MDSWYTGNSLIDEALSENYHLIGGVRSNRNFYPDANKIKISEFATNLDPNSLDSVTVRAKNTKYIVIKVRLPKLIIWCF